MHYQKHETIIYFIKRELTNKIYKDLLNFSLNYVNEVVVTVRNDIATESTLKNFLIEIDEFIMYNNNSNKKAFSQIFDNNANIIRIKYCCESMSIIMKFSKKLYGWLQPNLPEDLCMFSNNRDWLISSARSRISYLILNKEERINIAHKLPKIDEILDKTI